MIDFTSFLATKKAQYIFITGGWGGTAGLSQSEIIDIQSGKNCKAPKSFPAKIDALWGPMSTKEGWPLVCGGHIEGSGFSKWNPTCSVYDPKSKTWEYWSESWNFYGTVTVQSPNGSYWIITGNTSYTQDSKSEFVQGPALPDDFQYGCALRIDEETTLVAKSKIYLYNHITQHWTGMEFPNGTEFSSGLACGLVQDNSTQEPTIAVFVQQDSTYTALLDLKTLEWTEGDKLPAQRGYSSVVPYGNSFLVIGGRSSDSWEFVTDTYFHLNEESMMWEEMDFRMENKRAMFFASVIEADSFDCEDA